MGIGSGLCRRSRSDKLEMISMGTVHLCFTFSEISAHIISCLLIKWPHFLIVFFYEFFFYPISIISINSKNVLPYPELSLHCYIMALLYRTFKDIMKSLLPVVSAIS